MALGHIWIFQFSSGDFPWNCLTDRKVINGSPSYISHSCGATRPANSHDFLPFLTVSRQDSQSHGFGGNHSEMKYNLLSKNGKLMRMLVP